MIAWLTLTGLSLYVSAILVFGALGAFIGLSRVVAEAGLPGVQTPMVPQAFITRGFGPEVLGLKNMTGLGLSTVWMGETAANMMNAAVHALKLTSEEGTGPALPRHAAGDRPCRLHRPGRIDLVHDADGLHLRRDQPAPLVLLGRSLIGPSTTWPRSTTLPSPSWRDWASPPSGEA